MFGLSRIADVGDLARQAVRLGDQGEFDALAHGVDAFGADADLVAEVPFDLARLCATTSGNATGSATTAAATLQGDDGVISLSKHAPHTGEFLERADGKKAFDEDFEEFDKAAVFLHGDNQAVVFLPEMLLHELSGFPIHQFALGAVGAALRF